MENNKIDELKNLFNYLGKNLNVKVDSINIYTINDRNNDNRYGSFTKTSTVSYLTSYRIRNYGKNEKCDECGCMKYVEDSDKSIESFNSLCEEISRKFVLDNAIITWVPNDKPSEYVNRECGEVKNNNVSISIILN